MNVSKSDPHFPGRAPIDGYGQGGFRFAGMSHRGSLLIVPSGIYAWPVNAPSEITELSLALVFAEAEDIDLLMIGSGRDQTIEFIPPGLHDGRVSLAKQNEEGDR